MTPSSKLHPHATVRVDVELVLRRRAPVPSHGRVPPDERALVHCAGPEPDRRGKEAARLVPGSPGDSRPDSGSDVVLATRDRCKVRRGQVSKAASDRREVLRGLVELTSPDGRGGGASRVVLTPADGGPPGREVAQASRYRPVLGADQILGAASDRRPGSKGRVREPTAYERVCATRKVLRAAGHRRRGDELVVLAGVRQELPEGRDRRGADTRAALLVPQASHTIQDVARGGSR